VGTLAAVSTTAHPDTPPHHPTAEPWAMPGTQVLAALGSSTDGLSTDEAARRLVRHGPNLLAQSTAPGAWRLAVRQFQSPLVLILVAGALIALVLRQWLDAVIILAIVLGSTALGFAQEMRASQAVARLRQRLALAAQVRRGGALHTLSVDRIVPGDIVLLKAGDLVPADARVIEARDFLLAEGSLTGEPYPVEKHVGVVERGTALAQQANMVHMGSSVRSGVGTVVVTATGRQAVYGRIAGVLEAAEEDTVFARGVRHFGTMLMRVMMLIVMFVLAINHAVGRPVIDSLLFAMALAVGLSPELLPAIISVTLSSGARAMARQGVIVRRLEAIENLGSIDVLCTDKTGTLTLGEMRLRSALDAEGATSEAVQRLAFVNSSFETGIENPIDQAIVRAGRTAGLSTEGYAKVDEIPYDFSRKRLTIVAAQAGQAQQHLLICKGAFDAVLGVCERACVAGREQPLDDALRDALTQRYRAFGEQGQRCLALATRSLPARERHAHDVESALTFQGFIVFEDPPKPRIEQAVAQLAALGIHIKIITGDNRHVAEHVARQVGIDPGLPISGAELAAMPDERLRERIDRTRLFVEVDPQQKERLVRLLQRAGHAVGYMGDGINDAPALHAADVGISVDDAVDVARESADVVLLRPDLEVLCDGISDGRRTFANTLKYIAITTSANFGNMMSMALANPLLPFLPLAAKQILLNNFLSDLPSIAISTDRVDDEHLTTSQRWDVRAVTRFMISFGLISTAFDLLTFAVLLHLFGAGEAQFQTAWFVESLLTELVVVLLLRTRRPAWRSRPSALLLWASVAVAAVALVLPYLGAAQALFGFTPLPAAMVIGLVAIVIGYALATEAAKRRLMTL
jgi:P-type Mg2+ transporter